MQSTSESAPQSTTASEPRKIKNPQAYALMLLRLLVRVEEVFRQVARLKGVPEAKRRIHTQPSMLLSGGFQVLRQSCLNVLPADWQTRLLDCQERLELFIEFLPGDDHLTLLDAAILFDRSMTELPLDKIGLPSHWFSPKKS